MSQEKINLLTSASRLSQQWIRKRRTTTIVFVIFGFFVGVEYSAVVLSMWFFIRDHIKANNPSVYYSIAMASMALSASIGSVVFGRYVDKSRNIKMFMLITISMSVIGNLLYTLQFSVLFPIFGRLICGMIDSVTASISGELARVYDQKALAVLLSKYQAMYAVGFVVGPATSILFKNIHLNIGRWQLNETNFIGIFMAFCFLFLDILVYFLVFDLSKEVDLKAERENQENVNTENNNQAQTQWNLFDILKNMDMVMIIISSGVLCYLAVTVELLIPILASEEFHWSLWMVSVILTIAVILFTIMMFTCFAKLVQTTSATRIILLYTISVAVVTIGPFLLMLTQLIEMTTLYSQISIVALTIVLNSASGFQGTALSRALILNLSPSHSSSYCEGVRNAITRLCALFGFLFTGFIAPYLKIASPIIICINSIFVVYFVVKIVRSKMKYETLGEES